MDILYTRVNLENCGSDLLCPTENQNKKLLYKSHWNSAIPLSSIFSKFYLQLLEDGNLNLKISELTRFQSK